MSARGGFPPAAVGRQTCTCPECVLAEAPADRAPRWCPVSTAAQRAHQMAEQGAAAHRAATDPTPAERYATERAAGFNRAEAFLFTAVYLTGLHARDDAALGADVRQLFVAHRADHPGATS